MASLPQLLGTYTFREASQHCRRNVSWCAREHHKTRHASCRRAGSSRTGLRNSVYIVFLHLVLFPAGGPFLPSLSVVNKLFTERDGRKGPPAGDKTRGNRTHTHKERHTSVYNNNNQHTEECGTM
jgi:hypothetical protein